MLNQEAREFIESWEIKLSECNTGTLNDLFNKFIALFTIFNRYYAELYKNLKGNNLLPKARYAEHEKATSIVSRYLGAKTIVDQINETDNQENIDVVCRLMSQNIFSINLVNGIQDQVNDAALLKNLQNADPEVKAKAILYLIYNVRNNILHGQKGYQEYQRMLIEPLVSLLEIIVKLLKERMQK